MNLRLPSLVATAILATSLLASAQTIAPPKPHAHWAEVTHKFETAPLDSAASQDAKATVKEIAEAQNFHPVRCDSFYKDLNASRYAYRTEILMLYILGSATYQVETEKTDGEGTNLYAIHSLLKGYAAILRQHPTTKDARLDELAKLDAGGKLADMIGKSGCT